jgi:hypothetical protein
MPSTACFVIDESGRARVLSASGYDGEVPPQMALDFLAQQAEQAAAGAAPFAND